MTKQKQDPHRRKIGRVQIAILLVAASVSTLVATTLGPVMPKMQAYFRDVPNADYLVPMVITIPILVMAVVSVFIGLLGDWVGRKNILVIGSVVFATFGIAPIFLDDLHLILGSRIIVGIAESAVMVSAVALIGDYFSGQARARMLTLQATVTSASALVFNTLGGVLGEAGWRVPFWLFAGVFLLSILALIFLWEPDKSSVKDEAQLQVDDAPIRFFMIGLTCVIAAVAGLMFLTVPVNFGYLFAGLGESSPARIGLAYAANSFGVVTGTILFVIFLAGKVRVEWQLFLASSIMGIGFFGMWQASDYTQLLIAGVVNGLGGGLMIPTIVTWNMRLLPTRIRGIGTGICQSSLYLGMFGSSVVVVWLASKFDGRPGAIAVLGSMLVLLSLAALFVAVVNRVRPAVTVPAT